MAEPNALMILGLKKKPGEQHNEPDADESGGPPDSDTDDVESGAVDDMFAAVRKGDRGAFKDALSTFVRSCINKESEGGYEGE